MKKTTATSQVLLLFLEIGTLGRLFVCWARLLNWCPPYRWHGALALAVRHTRLSTFHLIVLPPHLRVASGDTKDLSLAWISTKTFSSTTSHHPSCSVFLVETFQCFSCGFLDNLIDLQFLPFFWRAADMPCPSCARNIVWQWRSHSKLSFANCEPQCHGHILCSFKVFRSQWSLTILWTGRGFLPSLHFTTSWFPAFWSADNLRSLLSAGSQSLTCASFSIAGRCPYRKKATCPAVLLSARVLCSLRTTAAALVLLAAGCLRALLITLLATAVVVLLQVRGSLHIFVLLLPITTDVVSCCLLLRVPCLFPAKCRCRLIVSSILCASS